MSDQRPPPHVRREIAVTLFTTVVSVEKFARTGGRGMRAILADRIRAEFDRRGLSYPKGEQR